MAGGDSMRGWPQWRNACVVRACTIAESLRMIEFAVEGGLAAFGSDARTRVRALDGCIGGPLAAGSYVCVNVGEGRMRVLAPSPGSYPGARFMWSLIEGARVRLTVPAARETDAPPTRLAGISGVRLHLGQSRPRFPAVPVGGHAARAANANAPSRQHISF